MKQIARSRPAGAGPGRLPAENDPNNIAIDEGNSANAEIETLPPDETVTNDAAK